MTPPEKMQMLPDEYRVMYELENGYWWYRGLRALLHALLARSAPSNTRHARILDVGCGTGANLQCLQSYGCAIGIDISAEAIAFSRQRGIPPDHLFVASATDLPFADESFDLVVSFDVICNIPDDADAFAQIARLLKPGGHLIVQLPAYQWLWSMHDVAVGHQRRYDGRGVREKLARAGMHVERIFHVNALMLPFVAIQRLLRRYALKNGNHIVSDLQMNLPRWLNRVLSSIYPVEVRLEERVNFPFGLSVVAIARKK